MMVVWEDIDVVLLFFLDWIGVFLIFVVCEKGKVVYSLGVFDIDLG